MKRSPGSTPSGFFLAPCQPGLDAVEQQREAGLEGGAAVEAGELFEHEVQVGTLARVDAPEARQQEGMMVARDLAAGLLR